MVGYHDEMNYSERRYQQTIDDCKYSAQYFNAVAICPFTKGKIICSKLFSKHFIFKIYGSNLNTTLWATYKKFILGNFTRGLEKTATTTTRTNGTSRRTSLH